MTQRERRSRPGGRSQAAEISSANQIDTIVAPSTLVHPKAIAPAYAILVQRRNGQWHRQLYLSLHSATRAMERAEAKGVEARCQLVEIVPVPSMPVVVVAGGGADA